VNHRDKEPEEKEDHGMVELLKKAGGLSDKAVAEQLYPVLFSDDAKKATQKRINDTSKVIETFWEGLISKKLPERWGTINDFKEAQEKCQLEINTLRKDLLQLVSHQVIIHGQVRPPKIILEFIQKMQEDVIRLDNGCSLEIYLFCLVGYGSLQWVSAAPDALMYLQGIGNVFHKKEIPSRSLRDSAVHCLVNPDFKLGLEFYLGYHGGRVAGTEGPVQAYGAMFHLPGCYQEKMRTLLNYAKRIEALSEDTLSEHDFVAKRPRKV
jgi:hypothetical protein